jgi:hypothetical protein
MKKVIGGQERSITPQGEEQKEPSGWSEEQKKVSGWMSMTEQWRLSIGLVGGDRLGRRKRRGKP